MRYVFLKWITLFLLCGCFNISYAFDDVFKDFPISSAGESNVKWKAISESRAQYLSRKNDFLSRRQRFWGQVEYQGNNYELLGSARIDYDYDINQHSQKEGERDVEFELLEAYANYSLTEKLTLSIGKKRVTWGVADGKNTIDLINPIDGRDPIATGRSGTRLASDLISASYHFGGNEVELIFLPEAEVNRRPDLGNPWLLSSLQVFFEQINQNEPAHLLGSQPDQYELGFRLAHYAAGFDVNFIYFNGFNDEALYRILSETRIEQVYSRFQAYSLQMVKGLSNGTVRTELTFKNNVPAVFNSLNSELVEANFWQVVVGWDYQLNGNAYINLQGFYDSEPNVNTSNADISDAEAQDGFSSSSGITFAIDHSFFDDQINSGIRGIKGIRPNEYALQAYLEWQPQDDWQFSVGRYWFNGSDGTFGGEYHRNEFYYFQLDIFL